MSGWLRTWSPRFFAAALAGLVIAAWPDGLQHWLAVHTGSSNTPGAPPNYNFWSGFGSDITEVTIVGAVLGAWRKHNCHQRRCWRIGRHAVDGTPWCDRHHRQAREGGDSGR